MLWGASFYGVYVLLTRFFLEELNYSEVDTLMMLGAFGAVGPVFSVLGGLAADRFIGSFRSVYIGYIFYSIGFLLLGIGASKLNIEMSIFAIALIGYSRGLSAAGPTVLLGHSFAADKRDVFQQALTINYSINNLGSFIAHYVFPFFIVYHGYQGNFYISMVLMLINVVLFFIFRRQLTEVGNKVDKRPVPLMTWVGFIVASIAMLGAVYWIFDNLEQGKNLLYGVGVLAILYFVVETFKASAVERWKMCSVLVFMVILIAFYFYYGQMATSMNLYAINMMGGEILGFIPIKPESNAAFNPLWCFVMGAPMMYAYAWLEKKGIHMSIPTKFAVAFIFSAIAFTLLGMSTGHIGADGKIAPEWIVMVHLFQSIAELIVGALGVGFIFEMVPKRMSGFAVGLRAVTLSLSGIFAAVISTHIALPKDIVLTHEVVENVYGSFFYTLGMLAVGMSVVTLGLSKVISKMIARSKQIEESQNTGELTAKTA
ncbi:MFS transporter [Sansalvadorimonas verongulae]|nr:MFS transporter [Sansalvadorimonas verongulae]